MATPQSNWADGLTAPAPTATPTQPSDATPSWADGLTPTASTQTDQAPAPEGFLHSAATAVGISPEGVAQAIEHPVDTAKKFLSDTVNTTPGQVGSVLEHAIVNPEAQATAKARLNSPGLKNKVLGAEEYLESGIPLGIGSNLVKASEQSAAGNQAGMAGTIAGTVIPAALGIKEGERIITRSSDGGIHSFPVEQIDAARRVDPGLQVLEPAKPVGEVSEGHFTKAKPGPIPQHGMPVETAQPLDRATVDKLAGGKNLSTDAFNTLRKHVGGPAGEEIQVGSNPKNLLHSVSEPVQKTLTNTGLKINKAIQDAPAFKTNTLADTSSTLLKDIDDVRDNLPLKLDDPLNRVIDTQVQAAYPVLEATNPSEVLAYRRKIGSQIDWGNITNSPETAGEAKNLIQAKIYTALGNKLHVEIPETAALDKVFQPNLELQTFLDKNGVSRDPVEANAEHLSELAKGKNKLAVDAHNAQVARNWKIVTRVLQGLGLTGLGYDAIRNIVE